MSKEGCFSSEWQPSVIKLKIESLKLKKTQRTWRHGGKPVPSDLQSDGIYWCFELKSKFTINNL